MERVLTRAEPAPDTAARLRIGARVQLLRADKPGAEFSGRAALLLALVALEGKVGRRRAASLLWPGSPEGQARNNLRTVVYRLNLRLGLELLIGAEAVHIDPASARVELQDSEAMLDALRVGHVGTCELLTQAGVEADLSDELREWLGDARLRLRQQHLVAISAAIEAALAQAQPLRAAELARACVQLEPASEHWRRQLMDTLARCGDRAAALAAYEDCKAWLREHLGVQPDLQTRTVHLRILQGQVDELPVAVVDTKVVAAVVSPLTPLGGAARYPLVEREAQMAQALAALAQGQHVMLQGEAGVGKTRLLRQLVEQTEAGDIEQLAFPPAVRGEPYAALAQLLQEVQPQRMPRIGLPEQVELARLAPLVFPTVQPSQAGVSAPRLHAALLHWAAQLAQAGVQWLVLDDVHNADAASQAALAAWLAQGNSALPRALPRLVLAHRSDEIDTVLGEALVAAQAHRRARCIAVPRLSVQGVQALLQAIDTEHSDARAALFTRRTGGNPLFVIELAQHMQSALDEAVADQPVAGLDALLRSRLAACSTAAQQLASIAAVAARDFSVELATSVTGQPALALMPAWTELQHKGLFADHGLAHDLVREAALGALPTAIARTLHRQVALHLQGQGIKGARVLHHWLAAEDFDQALPHAAHQLYVTSALGLSTVRLEVELIDLMARLSDRALLANLWLSAELDGGHREDRISERHGHGLATLVARVERMQKNETTEMWLAFESARVLHVRGDVGARARAYAQLLSATRGMGEQGVERARVETFLASAAPFVSGRTREHALLALAAASSLPPSLEHARLFRQVRSRSAMFQGLADHLRSLLREMRAAGARHDLGAIAAARQDIALVCRVNSLVLSAVRYGRDEPLPPEVGPTPVPMSAHACFVGSVALKAGRFSSAVRLFELAAGASLSPATSLLALTRIRLGQWSRAKALLDSIDEDEMQRDLDSHYFYAAARGHIDRHQGLDPLPNLRRCLDRATSAGVGGASLLLLRWELELLTLSASDRVALGTGYLGSTVWMEHDPRRAQMQLDVAEAHAQAGSVGWRPLVLAAARSFRRGRVPSTLSVAEGLVRCSKLLQTTDPAEAAALMHVARRWVLQALPHVPADARASFLNDVPVNRLLLGPQSAADTGGHAS